MRSCSDTVSPSRNRTRDNGGILCSLSRKLGQVSCGETVGVGGSVEDKSVVTELVLDCAKLCDGWMDGDWVESVWVDVNGGNCVVVCASVDVTRGEVSSGMDAETRLVAADVVVSFGDTATLSGGTRRVGVGPKAMTVSDGREALVDVTTTAVVKPTSLATTRVISSIDVLLAPSETLRGAAVSRSRDEAVAIGTSSNEVNIVAVGIAGELVDGCVDGGSRRKDEAVGEKRNSSGCEEVTSCLLYTSPSPRDATLSRMPSSA